MHDFLENLVEFVFPRLKDWNGFALPPGNKLTPDNTGSVTLGLPPQAMGLFPQVEINPEVYPRHYGFYVNCVSNARGPGALGKTQALLSGMRVPFVKAGTA